MILAGVDEAGYGPLLGPLVVGGAAFAVPGARDEGAAGAALRAALEDPRHGVPVEDSKRLHVPARGPGPLEAAVLALLVAARRGVPRDGAALLAALGDGPAPADHPWYADLAALRLPLAADAAAAERAGEALRSALAERGVEPTLLVARALPEGRFNDAVAVAGGKGTVLFDRTVLVVEAIAGGAPRAAGALRVLCDRHGGRARYGALLQARFPGRWVGVVREERSRAEYALGSGADAVTVRFEEDADARDPAAAAASMAAKYLREVFMAALNRWFAARQPGLRPTAGYWTDGQRFLRDTAALRAEHRVDDRLLVRTR